MGKKKASNESYCENQNIKYFYFADDLFLIACVYTYRHASQMSNIVLLKDITGLYFQIFVSMLGSLAHFTKCLSLFKFARILGKKASVKILMTKKSINIYS